VTKFALRVPFERSPILERRTIQQDAYPTLGHFCVSHLAEVLAARGEGGLFEAGIDIVRSRTRPDVIL